MPGEQLIGVYRKPDIVRIELDDEARRRLETLIADGAVVIGEIRPGATPEQIQRTVDVIMKSRKA